MFNFICHLFANIFGSRAYSKTPSPPPPLTVPAKPRLSGKSGVFLSPWVESALTLSALSDLWPKVMRINYPAFPLMTHNVSAQEADRLVGIIHAEIEYARTIGALPLIVTTLGTIAPASVANMTANASLVADYYASVAKEFPGCAWEIGNEAEIPSGGNDAALSAPIYASIFEAHAYAIRSVDLTSKMVTAGTSGFHYPWIREVLTLSRPDAVGVHPYGTAPQDLASAVAQIGTHLPVWFTEFGLQFATMQQVSDYFAFAREVSPVVVWFSLSDLSSEKGQHFGLIDAQGIKRMCYASAKAEFAK